MSYEDCHLRNGKKIVVLGKNEPAASGKVNVIVTTVEDSNFPRKCARDPAKILQELRGGGVRVCASRSSYIASANESREVFDG